MITKKSLIVDEAIWKAAKREAKRQGMLLSAFIVRAIQMASRNGARKAKP